MGSVIRLLCACSLACLVVTALQAETIACLGDSLTAGYGVEEDQAWPALLQQRYADRDWTVVNAGLSGDTTRGALARLPWLLRQRPDWVVVALGANDGMSGMPVERIQANLQRIVERLQAGGVQVALAGMQLPTELGDDYRGAFAAIYPAVAEAAGVPLLPFLLQGVAGERELNQADGIHPDHAGHARIAETVADWLTPLLEADP